VDKQSDHDDGDILAENDNDIHAETSDNAKDQCCNTVRGKLHCYANDFHHHIVQSL